jgi:hypothetical protein
MNSRPSLPSRHSGTLLCNLRHALSRSWAGSLAVALAACSGGSEEPDAKGPALDAEELWIVGGWISTADEYTGYLTVVDDLSSSGNIDLSRAVEFGGDMVYASPGGRVVFVGRQDAPVIERWGLTSDNALEKEDEVSFANYGVTKTLGGGRNVIQFVDQGRAYYFDNENLQVIVFDPDAMTIRDSFGIDGLAVEGQEHAMNFIHRDGDRFIVTARYWDLEDGTTTPLVRAAIVDSTDDSVEYAEDTRCGDIAFHATDEAGNLYLASHPGHAVYTAAGLDGASPPPQCLLRIQQGESRFDAQYFVDLSELSGAIVGGLLQGSGDFAYVFQYAGEPIDQENWQASLRGDDWAIYRLELGNEAATYAAVENLSSITAYGSSFSTLVNGVRTPFLIAVEADFSGGNYYEASRSDEVVKALTFPGFPGRAYRVD